MGSVLNSRKRMRGKGVVQRGSIRRLSERHTTRMLGEVNTAAVAGFNGSIRLQRPRIDTLGRRVSNGRKFKHLSQ